MNKVETPKYTNYKATTYNEKSSKPFIILRFSSDDSIIQNVIENNLQYTNRSYSTCLLDLVAFCLK